MTSGKDQMTPMSERAEQKIPRRARVDQWTPAEHAIDAAVQAVEKAGADVRLTDAVTLLYEARQAVADYVDQQARRRLVRVTDGLEWPSLPPVRAQERQDESNLVDAANAAWRDLQDWRRLAQEQRAAHPDPNHAANMPSEAGIKETIRIIEWLGRAITPIENRFVEVAALPPVQATTAEAEPRYCQKCGSNAIRTVEPGLFVCDWCDAVMRDKSSPLRETPAPDLARVRASVEYWRDMLSRHNVQGFACDMLEDFDSLVNPARKGK